jgi:hypothetical protein
MDSTRGELIMKRFRNAFVLLSMTLIAAGTQMGGCGGGGGGGSSSSSSADLSGLVLSFGDLSPSFDAASTDYTVTVGFMGTALEVTPTVADSSAMVTVNGTATASGSASTAVSLDVGSGNTITVLVTNGSTTKSYIITATRQDVASILGQEILYASDAAPSDYFGISIALDGDTLVVGAYMEETGGSDIGAVYVYSRIGTTWTEQQKLQASDGEEYDYFGRSVALDGNTLVVGAEGEDSGASNAGAAYVFTRSGSTWTEQAILYASNSGEDDYFGKNVAISGDTVVVGAYKEDSEGSDAGAAYVFTRTGITWAQQEKLVASDAEADDQFGSSVALDGDTIVVGAFWDDNVGIDAGAAYVFTRSNTTWSEQHKLVASDAQASDLFGYNVSLDGDTVVVGAYGEDTFGINAGAAYVFTGSGSTWTEQAILYASDAEADDRFGDNVALDGDTIVVGAFWEDTGGASKAGSAYVFTRTDLTWMEQQKLVASDTEASDYFGYSVALDGNTVAVGAWGEDTGGSTAGAAYVIQLPKIVASDAEGYDRFGYNVALDGDTVVVGAYSEDTGGSDSGAAYVFTRTGTTWTEQQKLVASDAEADDRFGWSVALDGDTVVVGAYRGDTGGTDAGAAYVFTRTGTTWTEQEILYASDAEASDNFGRSVALDGDTVVVGAYGEDTGGSVAGAAYVFTRSGDTWTEQEILYASNAGAGDYFGTSVALDGDTMVVGAYTEDTGGTDAGAAYVFTRTGDTWTEQEILYASDAEEYDRFGISVALDGDTVVVGAYWEDTGGSSAGAAYVFTRSGDTWTEQEILYASDAEGYDRFGISVALDGDTVVVGAEGEGTGGSAAGAAYVFTRTGDTWTEQEILYASDAEGYDRFGISVALDGDTVVMGAYREDTGGSDAGAAYVFR